MQNILLRMKSYRNFIFEESNDGQMVSDFNHSIIALEKQIPKPILAMNPFNCPSCNAKNDILQNKEVVESKSIIYCWNCGNAMNVKKNEMEIFANDIDG